MKRPPEERAFIVEIIGRRAITFIEPATVVSKFVIANALEEATRFETAEMATIRARQELTPSTFNVREVSSVGGWHVIGEPDKKPTGLNAKTAKGAKAQGGKR
jgi:hypothetical protein